jgi:biotin transport system substrate-specific component
MAVRSQALSQPSSAIQNAALVITASLFVAVCAHVSGTIPFTPIPFSMQNWAVLLVGLTLGPRRGAAALALYLGEGAMGMPVFAPHGLGGVAQIVGPTGGYLMAYPFVAWVAGSLFARAGKMRFVSALLASCAAEVLLFACGSAWLMLYTHSVSRAIAWAVMPFMAVEAIKVVLASAVAARAKL